MIQYGSPIHIADVKAIQDDWRVDGYASTFSGDPDNGGDIVDKNAFIRTLKSRQRRAFLHSHDLRMVLGKPTELKTDKTGLFGRFNISQTTLGKDARQLALDGAMDSLSIGYRAVDYDLVEKGRFRLLKDIELYEVSLVAIPMNDGAVVTAVKAYQDSIGIEQGMTLVERVAVLNAAAIQTIADVKVFIAGLEGDVTETKQDELRSLLETFSGLSAVRDDLMALAPVGMKTSVTSRQTLFELREARKRLARILPT